MTKDELNDQPHNENSDNSEDKLINEVNGTQKNDPQAETKDTPSPKDKSQSYFSWYLLTAIAPSLLAFIILHLLYANQNVQHNFPSYREACMSGQFSSLKELHQFVREDITTVDGELARDDFLNTYYWKAKPVLMKGAAKHWPAYTHWTDEYLLSNLFDLSFYVDLRKHHSTSKPVRTKMNIGKFLRNYRDNDWYLDSMTSDDRFLDELIVPSYLNLTGLFEFTDENDFYQNFYLSSGNTNSPLHFDGFANLLTVLDGTKEWIIAEPDASLQLQMDQWVDFPNLSPLNVTNFSIADHPGLCNVTWKRAIVEPGDTLFVPLLHPHHVYSPPGRNMAVGMWFYLDSYNMLLEQAGFFEIDRRNISGSLAVYQQHVGSRPKPCDITECSPLGAGSLRAHVSEQSEQYSRDSDVPPPAKFPIKQYNSETAYIPGIAFGTGLPGGSIDNVYLNTRAALDMGYKLIDTAVMYGNEEEIGRAVRDCKWMRSSVKVVTKIMWRNTEEADLHKEMVALIEGSLQRLDLEYIDILLLHNTDHIPKFEQLTVVWKAMESFVLSGKVLAIGLSNTEITYIMHVQSVASVPISIVQNIFTPFEHDRDVYNFCLEHEILFMAYGVSGDYYIKEGAAINPVLEEPLITDLSELYHTSKHAILYNWAAQREVILITRTTKLSHMKENLGYLDVFLNSDHMQDINDLHEED